MIRPAIHRLLALACVLAAAPAAADTLVLQTEGSADAATRTKIDAALIKIARAQGAQVAPGDIAFSDAATAVGCQPETPSCKDEVLGMLTADEIIYARVSSTSDGLSIEVHRITKGGVTRNTTVRVAAGQPADKLDAVASLFATSKGGSTESPPLGPTEPDPNSAALPPEGPATPPTTSEALPPTVVGPPDPNRIDERRPARERLKLAGMIGGGALILVGFLTWGAASDVQDEIDGAPTRTRADLDALADLEARADNLAGWGNALFLTGAVIGGISTYYYVKGRRARRATTARITPTLLPHGAGIAITFGGAP